VLAAIYDYWSNLTESRAAASALEAANLHPGDCVLEVAVGTGILLAKLAEVRGLRRCVGVEPSGAMLRRARQRLGHHPNEHVVLCRADARHVPFLQATFDVVVSCYMLDLLIGSDIAKALQEFRRILKPGGRLVLLVMARQSYIVQRLWTFLYFLSPALVGGCRPVPLSEFVSTSGWAIQRNQCVSQNGFRSHLIVAVPT
jgi:ubiquinone/menaquinone biosynthesis C-methylase UbiE